jgi:hypothetical protein
MPSSFTSELAFEVYREGVPATYLGNTLDEDDAGERVAVPVPASGWFVRPTDPDLEGEHLAELAAALAAGSVPGLSLSGCRRIDDRAFAGVALPSIEMLNLFNTGVGNHGLAWLPALPRVQRLELAGTRVDDAGLAVLAQLPIVELDLGWTGITDRGLSHLRDHPTLAVLSLRSTRVTDDGLETVATLKRLRRLDLQESAIGDGAIARLRGSRTLEELLLGYTAVTNRSVPDLASIPNLRTLMLRVTRIGNEHDSVLAAQLPSLGTTGGLGIVR